MAGKTTTPRKKRGFLSKIKWGAVFGIGIPIISALTKYNWKVKPASSRYVSTMTGYSPSSDDFYAKRMQKGALITGGGILVSVLAAKSGVNRYTPKWFNI